MYLENMFKYVIGNVRCITKSHGLLRIIELECNKHLQCSCLTSHCKNSFVDNRFSTQTLPLQNKLARTNLIKYFAY